MTKKKKIKRIIGDIVKIEIRKDKFAYGRILEEPLFAFYDLITGKDTKIDIDAIISRKIIFKIWVMNYSVTSGRWIIIGNRPLLKDLLEKPFFFKQDPINKNKIYIYKDGKDIPASIEQYKGLERAAVWDPEHVEDRLSDFFDRKKNEWVESLKIEL